MLILDRNLGQSLMIGDDIRVEVVQVNGHQVRLGITAPQYIEVFRQEIYQRILRERRRACDPHDSFAQVIAASASLASPETTGIPIYRRLRHPWTRQD